jgi:signal transduction histidine kinase
MRKTLISQQGQLVQARMEAETADRSKSDFLAHMSHELRTPLNAILGFSELITHAPYGPVGDQRYTEFANDIQVSGRHLLKLINDILDLSKIEAGALTLDEATVSISEVFQVVERLTGERAGRKALKTHWSPGEGLPLVRTDERILSQILINLVTNAIKFTGSPGRVDVSAQLQADGTIALTVSDTGIGMREGDIELALKPFGQVSDNMTSRAEGTGLGLPLCDRFTQALGGTFEITSVYGKGTTVTVRLPASSVIKGNPIPGPRERARA